MTAPTKVYKSRATQSPIDDTEPLLEQVSEFRGRFALTMPGAAAATAAFSAFGFAGAAPALPVGRLIPICLALSARPAASRAGSTVRRH